MLASADGAVSQRQDQWTTVVRNRRWSSANWKGGAPASDGGKWFEAKARDEGDLSTDAMGAAAPSTPPVDTGPIIAMVSLKVGAVMLAG